MAVITVPTPLRDGLPDLTHIERRRLGMLARFLRPGATVIVESTSYPRTTQEQVLPWLEDGSGLIAGTDFHLGYSPERIDPGNDTWTLTSTPKIVSGIDAQLARSRAGLLLGNRRPERPGIRPVRRRARQDHREHLQACQHRPD